MQTPAAQTSNLNAALHRARVMQELKDVGVAPLGLWSLESRYLPKLLRDDEHIAGAVYGYHEAAFVMLIATGRHLLYVDKKPLATESLEIPYRTITGIHYDDAGLGALVTLQTTEHRYVIRAFNQTCARRFAHYIDRRLSEYSKRREC